MEITLDNQGTLYEQIARSLKLNILGGRLAAGSRLPSTRALAIALGVSRQSVIEAYELLSAEQLVSARAGSGTRVADIGNTIARAKRIRVFPPSRYATRLRKLPPLHLATARLGARPKYNLQYGEPLLNPALFNSWRRKLAAAALRAGSTYPDAAGFVPLRRAIADYLARRRGLICHASDILIVGGTQQALTLVSRVLLNEQEHVVVEDPHYQLAVHCMLTHGARITSVRTDSEGIVVAEMPSRTTRLAYVTPSHQFPSGVTMTLGRRIELLKWAARTDSWIFEDDYDSEFHSGHRPIASLRSLDLSERVIYVVSLSKTLFPSLRLGYIVCPKGLRDDLFKAKLLDDLGSPTIEQAALATFMQSRQFDNHLRTSLKEILNRRRTVVDALKRLEPHIEIGPHQGGMHLVIWFRQLRYSQLDQFLRHARSMGLGLDPIHPYYRIKPSRPGLIVGYAGVSNAQLKTALDLLTRCVEAI
jgi:GntR family transcriptional regulator / MocR family aminotransferase